VRHASVVFADLIDLLLPRRCVGCNVLAAGLCQGCLDAQQPLVVAHGPIRTVAAGRYDGPVRAAILRYKERGRRDLGRPLSVLLARAIVAALAQADPPRARGIVAVGIPSSRTDAAARGGDHVARLARMAGTRSGTPWAPGVLSLARAKRDSAGLDARSRAENLAGAFAARSAPAGTAAIIVDDIVTTGATVREAGRTLAAAGWHVLGAAVVAATPRRTAQAGPGAHTGSPRAAGLA
jgi:predicted amidophosphoribosyltransferase